MHISLPAVLGFTAIVQAWLPSDRELFQNKTRDTPKRWLPSSGTIRGVNLGSMFIVEPWMAATEWSDMGCGSYASEVGSQILSQSENTELMTDYTF